MRQPAGHSANHLDTAVAPILPSARRNHAGYGDERTWETRRNPLGSYDYDKNCEGNEDAAQMNSRRVLRNCKKLRKKPVAHPGQAKHSVQFSNRNLKSHPGEETNENST